VIALVQAMALSYTITTTITTASASGCLRLFHGTLAAHVGSLGHGIDLTKSGGEFWMATDPDLAKHFAELAEQQRLFRDLPPGQAIFACDVPLVLLDSFRDQQPEPWLVIYSQGYRFSQGCSAPLNSAMSNIEITFEE